MKGEGRGEGEEEKWRGRRKREEGGERRESERGGGGRRGEGRGKRERRGEGEEGREKGRRERRVGKEWENREGERSSHPLLSVQRQTVRECLASSPTQSSNFPLWLKSTLHTPTEWAPWRIDIVSIVWMSQTCTGAFFPIWPEAITFTTLGLRAMQTISSLWLR